MTSTELINGYAEWLGRFKWNWFGSLTFRRPDIRPWQANRIFWDWIMEIEQTDGRDDFRWVRVTEHGTSGNHLHFHVLVGGLTNRSKWPWVVRWNELAGDCVISYYRSSMSGIRYVVKTARVGQDFEIDFDLP